MDTNDLILKKKIKTSSSKRNCWKIKL